jgi:hypothetical protein
MALQARSLRQQGERKKGKNPQAKSFKGRKENLNCYSPKIDLIQDASSYERKAAPSGSCGASDAGKHWRCYGSSSSFIQAT